jgi:hypothetical protein
MICRLRKGHDKYGDRVRTRRHCRQQRSSWGINSAYGRYLCESVNAKTTAREGALSSAEKLERFNRIVVPHLDAAYNYARWLTRNSADAEDVAHDATPFTPGLRRIAPWNWPILWAMNHRPRATASTTPVKSLFATPIGAPSPRPSSGCRANIVSR